MNDSDTERQHQGDRLAAQLRDGQVFRQRGDGGARFDQSMARYEKAATQVWTSLGWLNFGQAAIFGVGMTVMMAMSALACIAASRRSAISSDQRHADPALPSRSTSSASSTAKSARA
jgi:ABC-type transport system involved in Fe-S cluster assembly fused permease/ATPase subunit